MDLANMLLTILMRRQSAVHLHAVQQYTVIQMGTQRYLENGLWLVARELVLTCPLSRRGGWHFRVILSCF